MFVTIPRDAVMVVLIGEEGHGKTTLFKAISRLSQVETGARHASAPDVMSGGPCDGPEVEEFTRYEEYFTGRRTLEFVDFPSVDDYFQHLTSGGVDGVVVVVSALAGCSQGTSDALRLAREAGVLEAVVWISHCDQCEDPALLQLVNDEVVGLLVRSGFSAGTPVIHGAAGRALRNNPEAASKLGELLSAMDDRLSDRRLTGGWRPEALER